MNYNENIIRGEKTLYNKILFVKKKFKVIYV